jgi:molybdenum cofactor guanylyltransferase
MRQDKAFLRLDGITLLEHAIATAKDVCETVALVGDKQRLSAYGWVVQDVFPGQGPLAGIHAALNSTAATEWNLCVAVDTPALPVEFLDFLVTAAKASTAAVTVPRLNGQFQPLCAVYRSSFIVSAEAALKANQNKIDPLFERVEARIIEAAEIKALGFPESIFDNVNTPEDWQRMQRTFRATHG